MHACQLQFKRAVLVVVDHQAHARYLAALERGSIQFKAAKLRNETGEGNVDGTPFAVAGVEISPVTDLPATPLCSGCQSPSVTTAIALYG